MKVVSKLMYLGYETRSSKKSGNSYLLAKFMEQETSSIFEFYIPADKLTLITDLGKIKPFTEVKTTLGISSFNNKANVDLEGVQA